MNSRSDVDRSTGILVEVHGDWVERFAGFGGICMLLASTYKCLFWPTLLLIKKLMHTDS